MPQIFELFGYRLKDRSAEAEACRKAARCPFMQMDCDGGGNRYLSHVPLSKKAELRRYFTGKTIVPSGVCSIQPNDGERPWIVCPRRLLVLKSQEGKPPKHQDIARRMLFGYSGSARGTRLGVWPEVKIKYRYPPGGADKIFDYSFD